MVELSFGYRNIDISDLRIVYWISFIVTQCNIIRARDGSRAAATSKMERFVIIVNGWKPLTIITKRSILDVAAALDSSLRASRDTEERKWNCTKKEQKHFWVGETFFWLHSLSFVTLLVTFILNLPPPVPNDLLCEWLCATLYIGPILI